MRPMHLWGGIGMRKLSLAPNVSPSSTHELLRELVAHLQQNRTLLREEWARRITEEKLLTAMSKDEIFAEATAVYDNYVEALESGTFEALQAYARNLSERIIPRGVETHEVIGIVLLLRDVLARSLFAKYQSNFASTEPHPGRLRARREPHLQHGGGGFRAGTRTRHPRTAGSHSGAVDAGAASP